MNAVGELERGRRAYESEAWAEAYEALSAADRAGRLAPDELELLATASYMLGRQEAYLRTLERAYRSHLDIGGALAALRCAFWIGVTLASGGEMGSAGGWLARAQRLLDREGRDRVEAGYLLLPLVFEQEAGGDLEAAAATAADAAAIGERHGDPDLVALAAHEQGHLLIRLGRLQQGIALLDESMVAVTAGDLSPIPSGIVYCGVILACRDAHELRRAQEWTAALSSWCDRQPDLVAFTGRCLVHRAELMQLNGTWAEALSEAQRATERCLRGENPDAAGEACYREGEIHRLQGRYAASEEAYRRASGHGREPQPGLALLRLAQGKTKAAEAAIRRIEAETSEAGSRTELLPAFVEVMLAVGDLGSARQACDELDSLARESPGGAIEAMAAQTRGGVELAGDDPQAALGSLRRACELWQQLEVPYETGRARELVGLACRALGDGDAAAMELEAARAAFANLRAPADLARLESDKPPQADHGLTRRELEVLRHLAAGKTNKAIADELVLSVRTVDRHVSNIYAKFGVSSRAAATAYAHEHGLF